jgi:hypothetical protein
MARRAILALSGLRVRTLHTALPQAIGVIFIKLKVACSGRAQFNVYERHADGASGA